MGIGHADKLARTSAYLSAEHTDHFIQIYGKQLPSSETMESSCSKDVINVISL